MTTGWERGTARVLDDGRPVGAAFLIPGDLLVTCCHVISAIAGQPPDQPLPAGLAVTVDFPLAAERPRGTAVVRFSAPVAADNTGDVAVLHLVDPAPPDAVPMRVLEADDLAGHRWRAIGFPKFSSRGGDKDAGIWTSGTIEGREGTGWWQLTIDEGAAFPLAGGYSGAPVWDEEYQGVIGVVVAVERDERRRTGYALTVESLAREWPQLREHLLAGSPYRDLWPFTEHDSGVFHGRDTETSRLAELVEEQHVPIVPVLGASGVGKSSLVGAGLLAHAQGTGDFLTAHVPHGLRLTAEELVAWALASAGGADVLEPGWLERWRPLVAELADEGGIHMAVARILSGRPGRPRLLLVVDQFEALIADAPAVARRLDTMLGVLTGRRSDGSRPAQAVVVARADFLRYLETFPNIHAGWEATHMVVPPMTRDQLREVITRPLDNLTGIRFADGLVDQILKDTPAGAAALPMLEYTLTQLWARQERGVITASAYRALGGVEGALAGNAERALAERADSSEHHALERIFTQLVRPGEQLDAGERGPDTRRVAERTQFSEHEWFLIHRLASTRLVVVTRRPSGPDTVELAHDALLEMWPRLTGWIEKNREFRTWQEELRRAMTAWEGNGRDPALTLDSSRVATARRWVGDRAAEIPAAERDFIERSHKDRARDLRRRRLRYLAVGTALLLAVVATVVAIGKQRDGAVQQRANTSRRLAAQAAALDATQPNLAKQLRVAAYRISPTPEAFSALTTGIPLAGTIPAPGVTRIATGGDLLAIASGATVRLWSLAGHGAATITTDGPVTALAFTSNTNLLATASSNGIQIWDTAQAATPRLAARLGKSAGPILQVAFDPAGRALVSAEWDHTIRVWNVADFARPRLDTVLTDHSDAVTSVAYSPDGRLLASAGKDRAIRLWDVADPARPAALGTISVREVPRVVTFAPTGQVLASAGDDGHLRLWDVTQARKPRPLAILPALTESSGVAPDDGLDNHELLTAVTFNPAGDLLAATGPRAASGHWTHLWDLTMPTSPKRLPDLDAGGSSAVAFTGDGTILATLGDFAGADRSVIDVVQLWDVASRNVPSALVTLTSPLSCCPASAVALSADARIMAVAGLNIVSGPKSEVGLFDLTTAGRPRLVRTLVDEGSGVAISGRVLATARHDGVTFRDLSELRQPTRIGFMALVGNQFPNEEMRVEFSSDGRLLAVHGQLGNKLWLLNVADPTRPALLTVLNGVTGTYTSFGPDSSMLINTFDGKVTGQPSTTSIWTLRDPAHPVPATSLMARIGQPTTTALAPGAPILAAARVDGAITLWDVTDVNRPTVLGRVTGGSTSIGMLRFSADNRTLAGVGHDGALRLWDTSTPTNPAALGQFTPPKDGMSGDSDLSDPVVRVDGRRLVATNSGLQIKVWDTSANAIIVRLCSAVGEPMTTAQWRQYIPETDFAAPCRHRR